MGTVFVVSEIRVNKTCDFVESNHIERVFWNEEDALKSMRHNFRKARQCYISTNCEHYQEERTKWLMKASDSGTSIEYKVSERTIH